MRRVAPAKPTLELLRSLSDEHVLRALMAQRQATRAEIAAATGLSKPTVSESVRRLSENGSVVDTGERTTGRGRVGTYYALPARAAARSWPRLAPEGIVAEARRRLRRGRRALAGAGARARSRGGRPDAAPRSPARCRTGRFRLAVVSAADPVDRETGRLVELPDAPVPARRARRARRAGRAGRRSRHGRQRRQLGGPRRARSRPRAATSSTCSSARVSAAPWSATARSGAATRGWPARSPTW